MNGCEKDYIPSKIELSLFHGDVNAYTEALYKIFKRDFIENELYYQGKKVEIIHEQYYNGKERSFWHIISEGGKDEERTPISRRAETITWAKALIVEETDCEEYKSWIKFHDKTNKFRHYIWCSAVNYLVILEDRGTYYKLITAYQVHEKNIVRYNGEYLRYKASINENAH